MRKDFGPQSWLFPMPVLIIGTYDENGNPDAMNAAWGSIYDYNQVTVSLGSHVTTDNIRKNKAFTISFATEETLQASDFVGTIICIVKGFCTFRYINFCSIRQQREEEQWDKQEQFFHNIVFFDLAILKAATG